jgi:hypothetical protein
MLFFGCICSSLTEDFKSLPESFQALCSIVHIHSAVYVPLIVKPLVRNSNLSELSVCWAESCLQTFQGQRCFTLFRWLVGWDLGAGWRVVSRSSVSSAGNKFLYLPPYFWPPPPPRRRSSLVAALVLSKRTLLYWIYVCNHWQGRSEISFFSLSLFLFSLVPVPLGSEIQHAWAGPAAGWVSVLFLLGRAKLHRHSAKWHKAGNKRTDGRTDGRTVGQTSCCYICRQNRI